MVRVVKNEISATNDSLVSRLQREIQHLKGLLSLSKKGNLQDISKELLLLKEENERLRKITKNLTVEEVESLKQENKKLRLELQGLKEKDETGEDFWHEERPISTKESKTSKTSKISKNSQFKDKNSVEKELESWKNQEMEDAVLNIKAKMTDNGRCPVCTLKVPCKHYETTEDLPKNHVFTSRNVSLPPCGKRNLNETMKDVESRNSSFEQPRKLSFRTRAKNSYNEESATLLELKEEQAKRARLKETETRLIKLSKIEAYREEKLRKELENLERERIREEEEMMKKQQKESYRKKYLEKQKIKLEEFQRFKDMEVKELREKMMQDEESRRKKEMKKKQYLEEQKKKISDYQSKKKMMEEVTMDQIEELSNLQTAKEVFSKKHFTFKRTEELS
jgi:hypothetical protein